VVVSITASLRTRSPALSCRGAITRTSADRDCACALSNYFRSRKRETLDRLLGSPRVCREYGTFAFQTRESGSLRRGLALPQILLEPVQCSLPGQLRRGGMVTLARIVVEGVTGSFIEMDGGGLPFGLQRLA